MSDAKHTPGAWSASWNGACFQIDAAMDAVATTQFCYATETEANATLIAAAPDLLAALNDALEAITQDNQPPVLIPRPLDVPEAPVRPEGTLIVIGHRFKSRIGRYRDAVPRNPKAI